MNFASLLYILFLLIAVIGFYRMRDEYRIGWLFVLNYIFYGLFGFGFLCLLFFTTAVTFYTALNTYNAETNRQRKFYFFLGIILDLIVFIVFKYLHIVEIGRLSWPHVFGYSLLIPIGISFYTFKTVGYCIDVYKGKIRAETSFLNYASFVGFFPHIISGPITGVNAIGDQLKKRIPFDLSNISEGGKLILWGFFKKVVLADTIAEKIDPAFNDIRQYHGPGIFILFFLYAYQLYLDFSGYSDIAIGSARCFGVELNVNFTKPFFAGSFKKFWVHWHASLSKWMVEYVYIPLGGNKNGKIRTCINLSVVFIIAGIWHGFAPHFFLFAAYTLLAALIEFLTIEKYLLAVPVNTAVKNVKSVFTYFYVVTLFTFSMIFFRTVDLGEIYYVLKNIFCMGFVWEYKPFMFSLYLVAFVELLQYFQPDPKRSPFVMSDRFYIRLAFYLLQLFMIIILANKSATVFEYFQF